MPRLQKKESIDLMDLKETIVGAIKDKYGMSVSEFSRSGIPEKNKINGRNLSVYLSSKGSTSFVVMQKLCKLLELGNLRKSTKVSRSVEYYM